MDPVFKRIEAWANKLPQKQLFSFLNADGDQTDGYSYDSFLHRTNVVAGHLRHRHGFETNDRLLLAYPPGLEMIVAFFSCVRAGLIPVPVSPPSAQGFEAAWHKMQHIARDCRARAILTSREGLRALNVKSAGNQSPPAASDSVDVSGLDWIVTDEFVEPIARQPIWETADILFLQYTSGSTNVPKGVMVSHDNILHNCDRVVDHSLPITVSWLPQYHDMGLIGYYIYTALTGGTTYGFAPTTFIQRPSLWLNTITKYRATASSAPNFAYEYCLRPGRLSGAALENIDLSSLRFLMAAAEPIKSNTFVRFLQTFQKYGLKPECYFVAYGLAENTLAVSNHGRTALSVNRKALARDRVSLTNGASAIVAATHIMSCGKPLDDVRVKIVDPAQLSAVQSGKVGEIWIAGGSKCLGYWNKPELSREHFHARLANEGGNGQDADEYLRTGDMGFMYDGELYVCGRLKDMIVVRGQNYYPQDIETTVENASDQVRKGCVAAFEVERDHGTEIAIVAEVTKAKSLPDPVAIEAAVRNHHNVEIGSITFVAPKSVPRTSSGKIMRHMVRRMWENGEFNVIHELSRNRQPSLDDANDTDASPLGFLRTRYNLTGNEAGSLLDAGLDSLDLVIVMHEIKQFLEEREANVLAKQVDVRLIQQISIAELFRLADQFQRSPEDAIHHVRKAMRRIKADHIATEQRMMRKDTKLTFRPPRRVEVETGEDGAGILLTGGTGFLGPFMLKSLLEQTNDVIYVLIRAADEARGLERLKADMCSVVPPANGFWDRMEGRVVPVCGDLGAPNLGLTEQRWDFLARQLGAVYHNAAVVNYLLNYDRMRGVNVTGTNEILRLAFEHRRKVFNYVSTTFIFGWAVKDILYEQDSNDHMALLDFGYSQSKWVAERIVADAGRLGLPTRIFRPALITPAVDGGGNNLDITMRLLAFMVKYGIGVDALNQVSFVPADVAANNIVAISNLAETVNRTFHVTTDAYSNMTNITDEIERQIGRSFELFSLPDFVPEVIKRCTREDPLYPLLDFLIGSIDNISSMEFKRYDSSGYQRARNASSRGRQDASLGDTVGGILRFMDRQSDALKVRGFWAAA